MESTWVDTTPELHDDGFWVVETCDLCPPRNLWAAAGSDTNYWYNWLDALARGYGGRFHSLLIWNEPNDVETTDHYPGVTGWWKKPNFHYNVGYTIHDLCSLYVRMCWLADSVFNNVHGLGCPIVIGDPHRLRAANWGPNRDTTRGALIAGVEWVDMCYEIAEREYGGAFWTAVSAHPYQDDPGIDGFEPAEYELDADTVRAIMLARDHGLGELWNSEVGWDTADHSDTAEESNARNLVELFVTTLASGTEVRTRYDRAMWWQFREHPGRCGSFPLLNSDMDDPYCSFYACRQMTGLLQGKRPNGRVLTGSAATDSAVRVCEFEAADGRKTWVAWQNDPAGRGIGSVSDVPLPARADSLTALTITYDGTGDAQPVAAGANGWLLTDLTPEPVYLTETDSIKRPDIVVDSVWYRSTPPQLPSLYAFLRNAGRDSTGTGTSSPDHPATVVRFYENGSLLGYIEHTKNIKVGDTLTVGPLQYQPLSWGNLLIQATANETQAYVELGMDDNAAYKRY